MKVIVHDLQEKSWQALGMKLQEKDIVISEDRSCAGRDIEDLIGSCGQLVLISRCVYGGFSPFVQGVLEKCRRHFGPFLEMRHGQTHYEVKSENRNTFGMVCCFYGDNITPREEQSARIQSVSDGISLQAKGVKIVFYDTIDKLRQLNGIIL
ncbi:MAG: hypothetical protein K2N44_00595 [Lachnospiraceae bacterium]|nr:hypothetical protein [Lachnospiraceae bacterium]MDE6056098.1 hypothetical protein [Lachnospiraceae bacterium]MDE7203386.1 hypothetical protein [Lachnospiraceae bacterium]MDE7414815.1 hypothetical protein [Lachnospiraceae bacterium]